MLALSDFSCCREAATSSLLPRGTTPQRYFCNDGQTCFCVMLKGVVIVFFYVIVFCCRKTIRLANAEGRASDDPCRSCLLQKRVSCIVSSKYFKCATCVHSGHACSATLSMRLSRECSFLPDVEECKSAAETELDQSFELLSEAISGIHGAMTFDKAS